MTSPDPPSPHKRLFVAFPVSLNSTLNHALKRTRINADKKEMEFYWIPEPNLHVTTNFIGETETSRIPDLEKVLQTITHDHPPIKTSLRGMGAFPDEHHMRVLWVGVRRSRALADLQDEVAQALAAIGFDRSAEERDYVPHLTIGRLRKSRTGVDLISPFVRTSFGDLFIERLNLYESVMAGSHPVYKCLSSYPLNGVEKNDEVD